LCELFVLSCNRKDRATFNLPLFARYHEPYWHGWGIGYYEETYARVVRNTDDPNFGDSFRQAVQNARSNIVAHIRLAITGEVCQENCHPFRFKYLNRNWLFAHNGTIDIDYPSYIGGNNDSARAFSFMMDKTDEYLGRGGLEGIYPAIKHATRKLLEIYGGRVNYLLSDSNALFVFCNYRRMYMLKGKKDYGGAILISTQKLTNENWIDIPKYRILCVVNGELFVVSDSFKVTR